MTLRVSIDKPNFNIVRQRALFGTTRALQFLATNINREIINSMQRNDKTGQINERRSKLLGITYRRSAPQEALSSDTGKSLAKVDYTIVNPLNIVGGFRKFGDNYVRKWENNDDISLRRPTVAKALQKTKSKISQTKQFF